MNANDLREYRRVCDAAERIGFKVIVSPRFNELFALIPHGDDIPVYSREAIVGQFASISDISIWIDGWTQANAYHGALGFTKKRREIAENKVRQRQLMDILKNSNQSEETE